MFLHNAIKWDKVYLRSQLSFTFCSNWNTPHNHWRVLWNHSHVILVLWTDNKQKQAMSHSENNKHPLVSYCSFQHQVSYNLWTLWINALLTLFCLTAHKEVIILHWHSNKIFQTIFSLGVTIASILTIAIVLR